jgi:transcriptional regulator with XRE-family HTH domain
MVATNTLLTTPPYAVEQALKHLGANLRTARIRRRLTIAQVAQRIGTGVRAISDAEKGKPSTSIAVYVALLWVFDLLSEVETLADPARDKVGLALVFSQTATRARHKKGLDNDF